MKTTSLNSFFMLAICLTVLIACKEKSETTESAETDIESVEENEMANEPDEVVDEEMQADMPTVNISPDQTVSSPLMVKVNSQGVWMAFEGELGWAILRDDQGIEMAKGILKADGDWMKSGPVMFSTELTFDATGKNGGTLTIMKNPGPGDGDEAGKEEAFEMPVRF